LLLQCSKFSRSKACCVAAISSHAPELAAAMQQVFTFRSLLLQRSKLRSRKAPKLAALQGLVAVSSHAPELAALQGLVAASKLRSFRSSGEAPELGCLFKQNKQKKIKK